MVAECIEETKFRSAHDAISYAFRAEAIRIAPESIREGGGGEMTPWEVITDGMMIKSLILRSAGFKGRYVLSAAYTKPVDQSLHQKKEESLLTLAKWLDKPIDVWFLTDVVRDWTGDRMHHSYTWWADHLKKPYSTLKTIACSKREKDNSCYYQLRQWETATIDRVSVALKENGLIP